MTGREFGAANCNVRSPQSPVVNGSIKVEAMRDAFLIVAPAVANARRVVRQDLAPPCYANHGERDKDDQRTQNDERQRRKP
jgi:hypothetical protein